MVDPTRSAMKPCDSGMIAPPTIAVFSSPEAFARQGPQSLDAQREDAGEHDGVEQADASMLHMATWPVRQHGDAHQHAPQRRR